MFKKFKEGLYLRKEVIKNSGLPFSIAHISDLHWGINQYGNSKFPEWVKSSVFNYLKDNPVEVLCVTGDLIDKKGDDYIACLNYLYSIPVNFVIVSLGNHDEPELDNIFQYYMSNNVLRQKVKLGVNTNFTYNNVNFISLPDKFSKYYSPNVFTHLLNKGSTNIILAHNPNCFWDIVKFDTKYTVKVLSGHTHGGQIFGADLLRRVFKRFISKGKLFNALKINHEHDCFKLQGSYNLNNCTLHITNGLGYHSPGRFFCPPTITIYS